MHKSALRGPLSQLEAIVWFWKRRLNRKGLLVDSPIAPGSGLSRYGFRTCWSLRFSSSFFFILLLPINSAEADEETGDHVEPEREGGAETGSEAEVEAERKTEAEGEPEGDAENAITHISEAERLPDITHKPSGAHREGAEM